MRPTIPATLRADPALRELLLTHYLDGSTSAGLTEWLRDIGQDTRGSIEEKRARIRAHTKYLTMPAEEFPDQTRAYLEPYAVDDLADLCERLALSSAGTKDTLYRRIFRELHYREGWITRLDQDAMATLTAAHVMPILGWFPLNLRGDLERDFYPVLLDELTEVFGSQVFEQLPVAHGSTLKIDFHVGDPQGHGVGIEVKMPKSNADIQRTLGQLDQYQRRYGEHLVLFVIQDFLKPEIVHFAQESLKARGVRSVWR